MPGLAPIDYGIIILFFVLLVYFSYLFRQVTGSTKKYFLAGRSLPGWLAGITFISGNVSAMEILGLAGGAYVYGLVFAQYDWIGAIPAMIFLSLILVRYYYGNRIYNLLEYTGRRFGESTRVFHSMLMLSLMLLALGVGLYALALSLKVMLGLPILISILAAAGILAVITAAGGFSAAVLVQFVAFLFIWFTLLPLSFLSLKAAGGWAGLRQALGSEMMTVWRPVNDPFMSWPATLLGLGFALSFASWSTDQAIMQNVLAARTLRDARMAPLVGGIIKLAVPLITVIPGMAAAVILPDRDAPATVIFRLIQHFYPTGLAGLGFVGVMAGFTAMNTGMIMGISNIFTRNIYSRHIRKGASERHYLTISRFVTGGALVIGVLTALLAAQFDIFYIWMQEYNVFVIVPLLSVVLLGLFWGRITTAGAFAGLITGSVSAVTGFIIAGVGNYLLWRALGTLAITSAVIVMVSMFTKPKPTNELQGLVWGTAREAEVPSRYSWWRRPEFLAAVLAAALAALLILFA